MDVVKDYLTMLFGCLGLLVCGAVIFWLFRRLTICPFCNRPGWKEISAERIPGTQHFVQGYSCHDRKVIYKCKYCGHEAETVQARRD